MKRYRKPQNTRPPSRRKLAAQLAETSQKLHATQQEAQREKTKLHLRTRALEDKIIELSKKVDAYYAPMLGMRQVSITHQDTRQQETWQLSGGFGIAFQVDIQHLYLMPQACGRDAYLEGLADQFSRRAYRTALEKLKLATA